MDSGCSSVTVSFINLRERERERGRGKEGGSKYETGEDFLWYRMTCHWVKGLQYFEGT